MLNDEIRPYSLSTNAAKRRRTMPAAADPPSARQIQYGDYDE
ncbi:hypothetical protein Agau_C202178 [Agrobacterium tumefaciens F2]|nr:hypothetical protein Agau_C202178 [Agrobacterium tumefaciens F2]